MLGGNAQAAVLQPQKSVRKQPRASVGQSLGQVDAETLGEARERHALAQAQTERQRIDELGEAIGLLVLHTRRLTIALER